MKKVVILCLVLLLNPLLNAAEYPIPKHTDSRIKTMVYHPDQVYEITTAFGVATTISFEQGEEVLGVSLGDPSVWQIVPIGHTLNVKPIGLNPDTNLTVWTNKRLYLFHLRTLEPKIEKGEVKKASTDQDLLYLLKFIYPDSQHLLDPVYFNAQPTQFIPDCINENYTLYGDKHIAPNYVCDDGQFTYLQFSELQERPAIFFVDEYGKEHAVNTRQQDDYHVITRLGAQFSLRHGEMTTSLFNEQPPEFYL